MPSSFKIKTIFTHPYWVPVLAVTSCFLWGSAFPFVKMGYSLLDIGVGDTWGKILFAGYRFFLAGLFLFLAAFLTGQDLRIPRGYLIHIIALGLILTTLHYLLFYIGISHTSGINASILISTQVFFSIMLAHFFLEQDKISGGKVIGIILGFCGVILSNFSSDLLAFNFTFTGDGFLVLAQLAGAVGALYIKKIGAGISILVLTAYQVIIGSIFLIVPASLAIGLFPFEFTIEGLGVLGYLIFLSAVAFALWNTLLKYNRVGQISIFLFLIPVFGALLSAWFLGETITFYTLLSLLLVSAGIMAVYGKEALGYISSLKLPKEG